MKTLTQTITDAIWSDIEVSKSRKDFTTPDDSKGAPFSIIEKSGDHLVIQTKSGKSRIIVIKDSFRRALEYLIRHNHTLTQQACKIGASKDAPGPLDLSTRVPQSKSALMVIPYVIPILRSFGVLTVDGKRPNKVWLNL